MAGTGASTSGPTVPLTFGGQPGPDPVGGEALSDPVSLQVPALEDLAVSVYVPTPSGPATLHSLGRQDTFVASGNHTGDASANAYTTLDQSWYFIDSVDVVAQPQVSGTLVTFGDSITDGFNSTVDANRRWPNDLARRLDRHTGTLSVADEGISGDRVLTSDLCCGQNALARFDRDVVDRAGAKDVILLMGINDFGFSVTPPNPVTNPLTDVSAAQVIAGYEQIIAQAHAAGLKIFGATLTPFKGAGYYSARGEAKREAVNQWIRTSGAFDGVIDFDAVVRDPANPLQINPAFDSGDHLHPNDAGLPGDGRLDFAEHAPDLGPRDLSRDRTPAPASAWRGRAGLNARPRRVESPTGGAKTLDERQQSIAPTGSGRGAQAVLSAPLLPE